MTTLAYRSGVLAFDTQMSCGSFKRRSTKAFRLKDGSLFGITGNVNDGLKLRRWAEGGYKDEAPSLDDDSGVECIHVRPDGVFLIDGGLELIRVTDEFVALGSGGPVATGAMAMGASALKAVEIAAEFDAGTSGPFQTLSVGEGGQTAKVRPIRPRKDK
jgi:ATP-dependent protease HslVU (ClpYQ) peptidase subunit